MRKIEQGAGTPVFLYIVVFHPAKTRKKGKENKWLDEYRLTSILTTPLVAEQCWKESIVYVHRCGYTLIGAHPVIACSAIIDRVEGSPDEPIVCFKEVNRIGKPPKRRLYGHTDSYYEVAP